MLLDEHWDTPVGELSHYGVKGMKWGVRRTPEQLGRARAKRSYKKANRKANRAERKANRLDRAGTRHLQDNFSTLARGGALSKPYSDKHHAKMKAADRNYRKSKLTQDDHDKISRIALNKAFVSSAAKGAAVSAVIVAGGLGAVKYGNLSAFNKRQASAASATILSFVGGSYLGDLKAIVETRAWVDSEAKARASMKKSVDLRKMANQLKKDLEKYDD